MNNSINVLGAGVMGCQLISLFSVLGFNVNFWNRSYSELITKKINIQIKFFEKNFQTNKNGKINFIKNLNQIVANPTIEALAEDMAIKKTVISDLNFEPTNLGFFSNSSSFLPNEISPGMHSLHFFNPIYLVRLVETTCTEDDQFNKYELIFSSLKSVNFTVANVKLNRGFVGNFLLFREISNFLYLIERFNYSLNTIEAVQSSLGKTHGLISVIDFVGVDVTKAIIDNLHNEDSSVYVPEVFDKAISKGILGKKNKTSIMDLLN
jgi:3-hydroxyacyl-CoA dehydrogenase